MLRAMLGGLSWAAVNQRASEQRRTEKQGRKDEFDRKRLRLEIGKKHPENWGSE